jgi:hypothetical protein
LYFKTSEAQRLTKYFELGAENGDLAQYPWNLGKYCSKEGGYTSCTHWVGNIPVGDKVVKEYKFRLKTAHVTKDHSGLKCIHIYSQEGDYIEIVTGDKSADYIEAEIQEPCA